MKNKHSCLKTSQGATLPFFSNTFFFFPPMRMCAFKCLNELKNFQAQTFSSSLQFLVPENNLDVM